MEEEKRRLTATLNSPEFYARYDAAKLRAANDRLEALEKGLDEAYHRWDELETLVATFRRAKDEDAGARTYATGCFFMTRLALFNDPTFF